MVSNPIPLILLVTLLWAAATPTRGLCTVRHCPKRRACRASPTLLLLQMRLATLWLPHRPVLSLEACPPTWPFQPSTWCHRSALPSLLPQKRSRRSTYPLSFLSCKPCALLPPQAPHLHLLHLPTSLLGNPIQESPCPLTPALLRCIAQLTQKTFKYLGLHFLTTYFLPK